MGPKAWQEDEGPTVHQKTKTTGTTGQGTTVQETKRSGDGAKPANKGGKEATKQGNGAKPAKKVDSGDAELQTPELKVDCGTDAELQS